VEGRFVKGKAQGSDQSEASVPSYGYGPFILSPPGLPLPDAPILGAAAVHALLSDWRRGLQDGAHVLEPGATRAIGAAADGAGAGLSPASGDAVPHLRS